MTDDKPPREWKVAIIKYSSGNDETIWPNKYVFDWETPPDEIIHVVERDTYRLWLLRNDPVVKGLVETLEFIKMEMIEQDKIYNHPLHNIEDKIEETLECYEAAVETKKG